jgi:hypothetical protein
MDPIKISAKNLGQIILIVYDSIRIRIHNRIILWLARRIINNQFRASLRNSKRMN